MDQVSGLDGSYHYYATGAGVTIWVIDSGLEYQHQDFGGRAGNSVISIQSGYLPQVDTDPNNDACGHGTAAASAAAGAVAGIAKGATLVGIDVYTGPQNAGSNCPYGTSTSLLTAGIDYVLGNKSNGPNVITLSTNVYTSGTNASAFATALSQAIAAGITVVSSAGNDYPNPINACSYYPPDVLGVISVGATTEADSMSDYSDFGPCVTLLAPGDHITVADIGGVSQDIMDDGGCGNPSHSTVGYCTINGTSFAAPLVAGIAALYLQNSSKATPAQVYSALISSAVTGGLSAVPAGTPNLLASVWVPGNYSGTGPVSPGGGAPPGAATILIPTILNFLLAK